jgi:DNA-directed RNA polymerase specialized sigma24 family protein
MEEQEESTEDVLERLQPALRAVFSAYGVTPAQAGEIVEEACLALISKWPKIQNPDGWVLRHVVERCRRIKEEGDFEDPPE